MCACYIDNTKIINNIEKKEGNEGNKTKLEKKDNQMNISAQKTHWNQVD